MSFCLYNKKNIYMAAWRCEFYFLVAKIILPLENKIHIFAPPCNILYVLYCIVTQTFVTLPPKQKNSDLFPKYLAVLWFLFFFDHSVMFTCSKVNVCKCKCKCTLSSTEMPLIFSRWETYSGVGKIISITRMFVDLTVIIIVSRRF